MKRVSLLLLIPVALLISQCKQKATQTETKGISMYIQKVSVDSVLAKLTKLYGETNKLRMQKGVNQVASLWNEKDGTSGDFEVFCLKYFLNDDAKREKVFQRISSNFESLYGHSNMVTLDLKRATALDLGDVYEIDEIFNAYDPAAHFNDDFFTNKIAFVIGLNYPFFSLKEKEELGSKWSRLEWAYARLGDMFTARIPADISQKVSDALAASDNYISNYNIYMGNLIDDKGKTFFPKDMKLISHWNLRDELKANYN